MKYRIIGKFKNNKIQYKVQSSLFGLPFTWRTVQYLGYEPPHKDLTVPAECTVNCVFNSADDAEKCLIGLTRE